MINISVSLTDLYQLQIAANFWVDEHPDNPNAPDVVKAIENTCKRYRETIFEERPKGERH